MRKETGFYYIDGRPIRFGDYAKMTKDNGYPHPHIGLVVEWNTRIVIMDSSDTRIDINDGVKHNIVFLTEDEYFNEMNKK